MKYEPTYQLPPHSLPFINLEALIEESFMLDDHGNAILGDRTQSPKFVNNPASATASN